MIVNEQSLGFEVMVGQNKQFEDISLGLGNSDEHFFKQLIMKTIDRSISNENN